MPGKVVRVLAAEGTEVEAGQGVIVIEAMKMQNEMKSPKKGRVTKILAPEGGAVNAGDGSRSWSRSSCKREKARIATGLFHCGNL